MVWIKVCRVSLAMFSSFSDGQPTDKVLNKKAFKETSPPSQSHAFIEIYTCKDCFDGQTCTENHQNNIKTEVISTGVNTSVIYTTANMASKDQVLQKFESSKTIDEIKDYLTMVAKDIPKYNLYKNNCICFVLEVCEFLGNPLPDEKLQELKFFMERLSSTRGWLRLGFRWFLWIGCPLMFCYVISYFHTNR